MRLAIENIYKYHEKTKPQSWFEEDKQSKLGQIFYPIEKVGVYVPGGSAAYPSTVFMNCIPAQIASVPKIQVVSPPGKNGLPHSSILAALGLLKIYDLYAVGGAQSIAALAFGTETIEKVNMIAGPGNEYVAEAKRQVFGFVGIDAIAGPSEIAILLDDNVDIPLEWIASDIVSQAEHGPDSKSVLVTHLEKEALEVERIVQEILLSSKRKNILNDSLNKRGFVIITSDLKESIQVLEELAPEHLQLFSNQEDLALSIRNIGSIFGGKWACTPMGDYIAGPNHVLPTRGTAKFSSSLSVLKFMRHSSYIKYKEEGFYAHAPAAISLAELEGLPAHAASIKQRLD